MTKWLLSNSWYLLNPQLQQSFTYCLMVAGPGCLVGMPHTSDTAWCGLQLFLREYLNVNILIKNGFPFFWVEIHFKIGKLNELGLMSKYTLSPKIQIVTPHPRLDRGDTSWTIKTITVSFFKTLETIILKIILIKTFKIIGFNGWL